MWHRRLKKTEWFYVSLIFSVLPVGQKNRNKQKLFMHKQRSLWRQQKLFQLFDLVHKYSLIANVTPLRFDTITPNVWYNRIKCHYHASEIKFTLYCVCNVIEWSRNVFRIRNISNSAHFKFGIRMLWIGLHWMTLWIVFKFCN